MEPLHNLLRHRALHPAHGNALPHLLAAAIGMRLHTLRRWHGVKAQDKHLLFLNRLIVKRPNLRDIRARYLKLIACSALQSLLFCGLKGFIQLHLAAHPRRHRTLKLPHPFTGTVPAAGALGAFFVRTSHCCGRCSLRVTKAHSILIRAQHHLAHFIHHPLGRELLHLQRLHRQRQ